MNIQISKKITHKRNDHDTLWVICDFSQHLFIHKLIFYVINSFSLGPYIFNNSHPYGPDLAVRKVEGSSPGCTRYFLPAPTPVSTPSLILSVS